MNLTSYFTQWMDKLGLQEENFHVIQKKDYPGVSLSYGPKIDAWTIIYNEDWDKYHLIHKLGYVWLFKKYGILESMKKKGITHGPIKELNEIYDTIMDAISYFTLADMDLLFKRDLLDHEVKELRRAYAGIIPPHVPILTKIQLYIFCYLKYFKLFPEHIQEDFTATILYFLKNIQNQIIEDSNKGPFPLTKEIFLQLHDILDDFDPIKNTDKHGDILDYTIQIATLFPYWSEEIVIEQFNSYYGN